MGKLFQYGSLRISKLVLTEHEKDRIEIILRLRERPLMTSDDFGPFLTYLPTSDFVCDKDYKNLMFKKYL